MQTITVENFENGVTLFTINRPSKRNALSAQTAIDLQDAFKAFDESESQRVAVITGAGTEAFSAGADINDMPELWRCLPGFGITTLKPIIAAVSGWCIGGGLVITMMSDLAVAAENTRFSYPEGKLGLTQGMIAGLAGRIPHKAAMEIILWGQPVSAQRAYEMGLVNRVVPDGQHVTKALEIAASMAELAPKVLHTLKKHITMLIPESPAESYIRTRIDLVDIENSADFQEGVSAFKEKRKPTFHNK
ncbi:enoyl-CoA hydratase/isomerase family protein [Alcaligenaceae bacterium]|nr:enoyl-CoA hydratase/isomerase family protein [Alcaligenaceae bacterium]